MTTIFKKLSIDRKLVHWEDYLLYITPVEKRGEIHWKREDYFAPLGYGSINGSKLRQCIWLLNNARLAGKEHMITGASVKSPQLSMGTAVAFHYGMPTTIVIGSQPRTAVKRPNVNIALALGAKTKTTKIAYNHHLQSAVANLAANDPKAYVLQYGISTDQDIHGFHYLGSHQVMNIPNEVEHLVIPAGSCNSCVSVLYGLTRFGNRVKHVHLIGIGPNKLDWVDERLEILHQHRPLLGRFQRSWRNDPLADIKVTHYDLHTQKLVDYQDEVPASYKGIDFHPTYEGKIIDWFAKTRGNKWFWESGKAMFWIVGSQPSTEKTFAALKPVLDRLPS